MKPAARSSPGLDQRGDGDLPRRLHAASPPCRMPSLRRRAGKAPPNRRCLLAGAGERATIAADQPGTVRRAARPRGGKSHAQDTGCGGHPDRRRRWGSWRRMRRRRQAEHPRHLRRRHRPDQPVDLLQGPDGLPHAQHRPDRRGGRGLHRLLRRAELHRRPLDLHHRPDDAPHRPLQGRPARRRHRPAGRATSPSPRRSRTSATPPASSARTTSATRTSSCRPRTASTSSSATSTT